MPYPASTDLESVGKPEYLQLERNHVCQFDDRILLSQCQTFQRAKKMWRDHFWCFEVVHLECSAPLVVQITI